MATKHSPAVIEEYFSRFNRSVDYARTLLIPTIAQLNHSRIQSLEGSLVGFISIKLPAVCNYQDFSVADKFIREAVEYVLSWLDLEKKDVAYGRSIENDYEVIAVNFIK